MSKTRIATPQPSTGMMSQRVPKGEGFNFKDRGAEIPVEDRCTVDKVDASAGFASGMVPKDLSCWYGICMSLTIE